MTVVAEPSVAFDPLAIRRDFPILALESHGRPLVYLDNGATTQKPRLVIDALMHFYEKQNANIHRGVYELSQIATEGYEKARRVAQQFVSAADPAEIIFTRGTTEAINLVASSYGRHVLRPGDEVLVSALEHHSNIVPWQMVCQQTGAMLRVIPMNDRGELDLDQLPSLVTQRTKIVAVTHLSNALGTMVHVERIIEAAHAVGAKVLIDGAQWVAHAPTDVRALDADFYVFSGHKLFGPTGIGVLYGKRTLLDAMPPYQGGGDMIETVSFEKTTYAPLPSKFEAGTPNIAGAIGLSHAIDYVQTVGLESIRGYERELHKYLDERIASLKGLRVIGTAAKKASVVSFVLDNVDHYTAGTILDMEGVAVRTGHHCCMPIMTRFGIPGTIRASIAMYNTREDVDRLAEALEKLIASAKPKTAPAPAKPIADAVKFPEPSAASPDDAAQEIIDTLELFDDWQSRYQVIIELGEKLLPMTPEMKNEVTRVHGCQSTVHLFARKRPGTQDALDFLADSDADLVRGLVAILQKLFAGQSSKQILAFDIDGFFKKLGLDQHLSMGRRNGLAGMVQRIRAHANQLVTMSG